MEDDWDLHAVVRGCSAASLTSTASENPISCVFQQDYSFPTTVCFQDLSEHTGVSFLQELDDFYKPFFTKPQEPAQTALSPQSFPISPLSVLGGLQDLSYETHQQQQRRQVPLLKRVPQQLRQKEQLFPASNGGKAATHNQTSRSKRRKTHSKRLCRVAAENLSSDPWSWRKYGQKPIKGSPYPRGYYRCSTSKGCMARKQVERDKSDPGMFMVTYTAEHNHPMPTHRNSLAGSTRLKTAEASTSDEPSKQSCSSEIPPETTHSPATEKIDSSMEDLAGPEDEDEFSVSEMTLDDDFLVGLEDFTAGDCMSGHLPADLRFPWLSNSATSAAGGG